jgi:hypothetical protein
MKRLALVAMVAALSLGCGGLGQKMMEWSGSEIAIGEDATVPADFPLPAPPTGKLLTSAKVNLGSLRTTTVVYEQPADQTEAVLQPYEDLMKAANLTVTRTSEPNSHTVSAQGPSGTVWTAAFVRDQANSTLTLMVASTR